MKKSFLSMMIPIEALATAMASGLFLFSWAYGKAPERWGALVGSLLVLVNAELWRRIINRVLHNSSNSGRKDAQPALIKLVALMQVKLLGLMVFVFWLVQRFHLSPSFLLLGASVFPVAIVVWWAFEHVFGNERLFKKDNVNG